MKVEVERVPYKDKSVLRNLMELCQHDYSEFGGSQVDEHGLFGYEYLDNYWTEDGRHPFIVKVDGRLAGFALVREADGVIMMAEFFIMRSYRRTGIGKAVAHRVFTMFPGKWRVEQMPGNVPAQDFWRNVISEYTNGQYEELPRDERWDGPLQLFES